MAVAGLTASWALPNSTRTVLLASDPVYIQSALQALEKKYGSVDAFIEKRLKVNLRCGRKSAATFSSGPPDAGPYVPVG
jgi:hypothetical protein